MSDEIGSNQSHLCATEDAFEKFQAVSMYEEDEYIALSDIVSPPPVALDFAGELNDIPYENEVVLESNLEEQVPEVNSTIEICAEEEQSSQTLSPAVETVETSEEVPLETLKESLPLKRGRKKKTQEDKLLLTSLEKPDEHNGILDANTQSSEALVSPPVTQRKRGRRPKNANQTLTNSTTDPPTDSETPPDVPKRPTRTRIPNRMISQTYDTNATTPKRTPGKRGRPRKNSLEPQIIKDINLLEPENGKQDISIGNDTFSTLEKPAVKRGRKKKIVVEEVSDTPQLEESIEINQNCNLSVDQDENNIPITSQTKRSPGKRGRPKKIHTLAKIETEALSVEQASGEVTKDDEDDDADDVCLSQLKSALEVRKDSASETLYLQEDTKTNGIDSIDRPMVIGDQVLQDVTDKFPQELIDVTTEHLPEVSEDTSLSISEVVSLEQDTKDTSAKKNSKAPILTDFEHNVDNIVNDNKDDKVTIDDQDQFQENDASENKESLLVEDTSKRPIRRKTKQQLHYDEESDEDPFANIELSDEDDMRGRKGRYYSDDEYIPGVERKKRGSKHVEVSASDTSDSDIDNIDEEIMQLKRKKFRKIDGSPCKKRGRKSKEELAILAAKISPEVSTIKPDENNIGDDDVEFCLETSIIKATEDSKKSWGASNEFENFLAKKIQGTDIKIKKASTPVQPLEIPVIDANTVNKTTEISTQTTEIKTASVEVQTSPPYDIPMKDNVPLTAEQSESACEFLNSIVKTTAELGELMTQKSEDFIKKKINTNHVTDTFKMDYCVRKSFLLFKLAQHNLKQMEDDLAQQYDNFLSNHNLSHHREKPKEIKAEPKAKDSDSDCEIIEGPAPSKPVPSKKAVPFNPKTVFLNKELSIKIAKKPSEDKKLNIKGRHTVWINDSVMVKKVKPTQSFLAQDSRNKKPPDYVTIEMVNSFFKQYYREKALVTCAPFVSSEWVTHDRIYVCNYFFANTEDFPSSAGMVSESGHCDDAESNAPSSEMNHSFCHSPVESNKKTSPKTLFSLCTNFIQNYLHTIGAKQSHKNDTLDNAATSDNLFNSPKTLYTLCVDSINIMSLCKQKDHGDVSYRTPSPLKTLCYKNIISFIKQTDYEDACYTTPSPLKTLCHKMIVEFLCTNSKSISSRPDSPLSTYDHESLLESRPESPMWAYSSQLLEDDLSNLNLEPWMNFRANTMKSLFSICFDIIKTQLNLQDEESHPIGSHVIRNKSLPCKLKPINRKLKDISLKYLAYKSIVNVIYKNENILIEDDKLYPDKVKKVKTLADICFEIVSKVFSNSDDLTNEEGLTINAVNTLTEEAYHNMEQSESSENADDYYDDGNFYDAEIDSGINNSEGASHTEDNWLSQVKMKISSCYDPNSSPKPVNAEEEQVDNSLNNDPIVARIKLEPLDEVPDIVDASLVKSEPMSHLDEMTIIPESIITKSEFLDTTTTARQPIQRQNSSSFDVDQFESFVSTNKMIHNMDSYENEDEIFSQSALRVRRQHEPDSDTEIDMDMSLLVPQTFEPMPVIEKDKAKNILMESSSDESNSSNTKKAPAKKKPEKKSRGRPKKGEAKPPNNKEPPKEKPIVANEIAMITRRMRDKIRQQEKKAALSDSDHDDTNYLLLKKGKEKAKENTDKLKSKTSNKIDTAEKDNVTDKIKIKDSKTKTDTTEKDNNTDKSKAFEHANDEIQCSNVDSTEKVSVNLEDESRNVSPITKTFTGFTAVDQNEITSYQKYVKYVYDQILPKDSEKDAQIPVINPEDPVELLECEPAMPFFMHESSKPKRGRPRKEDKKERTQQIKADKGEYKAEQLKDKIDKIEDKCNKEQKKDNIQEEKNVEIDISVSASTEAAPLYVERHGWKCYPLDGNDTKLYQDAQILLEKLPETFVETYFRYQDISEKNEEDDEVDRLTNLQTLNRPSGKDGVTEGKNKGRPKCKIQPQVRNAVFSILGLNDTAPDGTARDCTVPVENASDDSRPASPAHSEHEFTPSEDEGGKVAEEDPSPVTKPTSDNNLAKNSLMNDNESDEETRIKQEPGEPNAQPSESEPKPAKKYKPGPKSKRKEIVPAAPVMLTADKMMNKELNLLHAPVTIADEDVKPKLPSTKGPVTRNKQKSSNKTPPKERVKGEDDSSSEEEKQWFTIKEKLLKRMVKNKDTTREDDAKRAKLVSEFIERRGDGTESYIKKRGRSVRGRRSKKKLLERQKQLKVLTRELFGDPSNDASLQRKKQTGAYFKGRRNIRKVLDKKSLAKSTVVANMEEFERKRRLNIRQNKLREVLRCEEGVNVLVINDEVCLEYDFEQHRPVVTIHPFFTKVMKAHQYEGVKFMWDACFESLDSIAAGEPGGGCILAHCMGLGKTLQVLALLHTVLTHPGVGMQRILVCCPLSTVLNWVDEIHKWIGPVTNQIKVFELSKLKKTYERAYQLEDWFNGGGIFIIGYELFRSLTTLDPFLDDVRPTIVNKIRTALLDPGPDIIICDEGHLLKNDCSVLAVAMSRVVTRRRIVLTGTPMQNNLREYYCMVNFVKPNLLGTYAEYSNRFENPIMNGQHRDSREEDIKLMKARTHILHKVLEGCLQRQEASVLYPYLPKKHEYTVFISLTKCQWDLYKHYLKNYGNTQNNKSILKDFHILQKIWSHPQVLHNFQMRVCDEAKERAKVKVEKLEDDLAREDLTEAVDVKPSETEVWWLQYLEGGAMLDALASSNKFVAVFRILDEAQALGDKVLIFSTSLFTMDTLEFFLKKINKWSLGQEYYRLDGSVPAEVRQKWCREFNAENNHKTKLFLISTRAGSLGLNMTAANRVIILDTSWNPAHDIQSIFRVYRFGQKKDCYIYRLVAMGTMEQKIYERSVTKQAVACRVVDEQQIDRHYNMAELTELYKYDEAGVGVAGGVAVGVEDVVLLRVARDAALHAVHEHDSLLRGSAEPGLPEHERNAAWMQFQQEHAHKQMQEDALQQALLEQKLKQEQDLALGIQPTPIPVKRPNRKYAKIKIPVEEPVAESILPEPMPPPPRQRGRKPKNANVVSCRIPIQPEVTAPIDPDKEMEMVKKIADILVKFNFHNHKSPSEISALVFRVRHIVTSGQLEQLDSNDQLTMSLASVFLPNDDPPMPALTDIECEPGPSIPKEEPKPPPKPKGRKKGSGLKRYVLEEIPSTSANPTPPEPDLEGSRTRRRAAIAAEKNFDVIANSVIDIDDDDWQNDDAANDVNATKDDNAANVENETDDWQLEQDSTQEKQPQAEPKNKKVTIRIRKAHLKQAAPVPQQEPVKEKVVENSILLSDDDEDDLPIKKKPGPARKTLKGRKSKEAAETPQPQASDLPLIPLHPSLLSNKNFIKIVAHTYLSGNPMLDEDAATLAAQYSTFKALKEYESTGKNIYSGPIYDIAVKVLGRDVLQKLHGGNNKVMASEIISSHPIKSKETAISKEVAAKVDPPVELPVVKQENEKKLKPVKLKIRIPPLPASLAAAGDAATPAPSGNVVPVGLFKRAEEGPSQTADECILPDDDLHIISDAPPPAPLPAVIPKITIGRRNALRMVLNNVKADSAPLLLRPRGPRAAPPPPPPPPPAPVASEEILSDLTPIISLDSDDDEPAPPPPLPPQPRAPIMTLAPGKPGGVVTVMSRTPTAPVPVSLTQAAPPPAARNLTKITLPYNAVSSAAPAPTSAAPMYLNAMLDAGPTAPQASSSNFVLVPASDPPPAVPVALSRVHLNSQGVPQLTRIHSGAVPTSVHNAVAQATAPQMTPQMSPAQNVFQPQQYQLAAPVYHQQPNLVQLQQPNLQPPQIQPPRQNQLPPQQPPPQPPPQAQPAPKAPPPAQTQNAGKPSKRLCKPGDILRITEGGKIEVLKRKDISEDIDTPSPSKNVTVESVRKTSAPPATRRAATKAPPQTPAKNSQPTKVDTNLQKQSSSSDDDPLSILRDVVHIAADDYITDDVQHSEVTPSKPAPTPSKQTPKPSKQVPTKTYSSSKSSEKCSGTSTQKTVIYKNRMPETDSSKGKERFLGSVDLTYGDTPSASAQPAAASKKPPARGLKGATTIVGTSKSIILCGSGKAVAKIDTPANTPEKREPLGSGKAATTSSKVDVKKRPAPVDTSATKKKKTDKTMTLKDFNIDDIDDIIELD